MLGNCEFSGFEIPRIALKKYLFRHSELSEESRILSLRTGFFATLRMTEVGCVVLSFMGERAVFQ